MVLVAAIHAPEHRLATTHRYTAWYDGTMTKRGEVQAWMAAYAAGPPGRTCKLWPFSVVNCGHARAWNPRTKGMDFAYRVIWEKVYGTPFPSPQACHTCGNGNLGCVNWTHIDPGTHADNMTDRRDHGRDPIGSAHGRALLEEADIWEICERLADGAPETDLAAEFRVNQRTISDIWHGRKWTHVPAPRLADAVRRCAGCETPMQARHARKRYCSDACRSRASGRKRTERHRAAKA